MINPSFFPLPRAGALLLLAAGLLPAAAARDIVINEIHYDPPDSTRGEEFVELFNAGDLEVDLSGWFFSNGIDFTFPPETRMAPGSYLVIAEDLAGFPRRFGRAPDLGPYEGRLDGDGETLTLRNSAGELVDEVNYAVRFPWPIAPAGDGSSMERIHPSLESDLGGSWRASGNRDPTPPSVLIPSLSPDWRFRKGTSEPSGPAGAWRLAGFTGDASWSAGQAGFGYGDNDDSTTLDDMPGGYTSIYLRHSFAVENLDRLPDSLRLRVYVDDGCVIWINGTEVGRFHVPAGELNHDDVANNHEAAWEEFDIPSPGTFLVAGQNLLAVHALNQAIDSSDFSIDLSLINPGNESGFGPPTPGEQNSVYSTSAPPQIRQVDHLPLQPLSGEPIRVTARVTDLQGVGEVTLKYQVVAPGDYIPAFFPHPLNVLLSDPYRPPERNPDFEDPANWSTLTMADDGKGADEMEGDGLFTAVLPPQQNRTLLRYRITAVDSLGTGVTVPYGDDPSLNFACFVSDGVPGYEITRETVRQEGVGHVYPPETMTSLAVYILITRARDITEAIAADPALQIPQGTDARFVENWEGAFVYEGIVYDHITYRLRGANGRYQVPPDNPGNVAGKRHWRFRFNKGRHLQARDRFGNAYPTKWRVLNTGRMFGNRLDGNWGLGDQVNDILWNAYGVPAPYGHAFHWRVIDGPQEAPSGADGQYLGDFWGIARAFENYDVRFLEAHGLPKGNLYKLVNQTQNALDQLRYQAPDAVNNGRDHDNIQDSLRPAQSDNWLNTFVNYPEWYRYHAIAQALRHYDYWPDANKNAAWYFEPDYNPQNRYLGRMWTLPFDADATWGPTWNDGWDRPYDAIYGGGGKAAFQKAYRNHIREVRDLLWQRDQLELVIRQTASFMDALEEADIDRWRNAPAGAGRQYFPGKPRENTLEGKIQDMLNFAFTGGSWPGGSVGPGGRASFLDSFADDPDRSRLPSRPTLLYGGAPGHPLDDLFFECSIFEDPQGFETFRALQWRLAEVTVIPAAGSRPLSDPIWRAGPVKLELEAVWDSGPVFEHEILLTLPPEAAAVGKTYRIRVRMMDSTELWSH